MVWTLGIVQVAAQPKVAKFADAFEDVQPLSESDFFENIKIVPLETKKEILIDSYPRFYANGKQIIATSSKQIFVFDKTTGKFIRKVATQGAGPDEFRRASWGIAYNETLDKLIAIRKDNQPIIYNISKKTNKKLKNIGRSFSMAQNDDGEIIGFNPNRTGNQKHKLKVLDGTGDILKKYENGRVFKNDPLTIWVMREEGIFSMWKNKCCFKEMLCDTIFTVDKHDQKPFIICDFGKYSPKYEDHNKLLKITTDNEGKQHMLLDKHFKTVGITEHDKLFFVEYMYEQRPHLGVFNKQTNRARVFNKLNEIKINGYTIPFNIKHAFITKNNELITYIEAYEVMMWCMENEDKAQKLPKEYKFLTQISENDNPLVIVAKLKQ